MLIYVNADTDFIVNTNSNIFGGIYTNIFDTTDGFSSYTIDDFGRLMHPLYVIVNENPRFVCFVQDCIYHQLIKDLKKYGILERNGKREFNDGSDGEISDFAIDLKKYIEDSQAMLSEEVTGKCLRNIINYYNGYISFDEIARQINMDRNKLFKITCSDEIVDKSIVEQIKKAIEISAKYRKERNINE